MTTHDDVVRRWHDRLIGATDRQNLSSPNMPTSDTTIWSYGSHFPLVRATTDRKGRPTALILNGDRYSHTTNRHQGIVRGMAMRSHLPHVIVPFSALGMAGIDPADVQIIETVPDRNETTVTERHTLPPGGQFYWYRETSPIDVPDDEIELRLDKDLIDRIASWHAIRTMTLRRSVAEHLKNEAGVPSPMHGLALIAVAKLMAVLTGVPFGEKDVPLAWEFARAYAFPVTWPVDAFPKRFTVQEMDDSPNGGWSARWRRDTRIVGHHLHVGARSSWTVEFSAFGFQPERPQQDRSYGWPVSESTGLHGMFIGVGAALMCFLTGTPLMTFRNERHRHWLGGSLLKCKIRTRRYTDDGFKTSIRTAFFISDFDANEPNPLYFFCELPRGSKPTTLAEAIECLKPEPVLLAEAEGRLVQRQGDIFAIELATVDRKALRAAGATFERMGELLHTNHVATDVAHLPNGVTVARGTLHHKPQGRRPDHIRQKLGDGKTWFVIVRNTVPVVTA